MSSTHKAGVSGRRVVRERSIKWNSIRPSMHPSNKYLLNTYYMPGTVLGAVHTVKNKAVTAPSHSIQASDCVCVYTCMLVINAAETNETKYGARGGSYFSDSGLRRHLWEEGIFE